MPAGRKSTGESRLLPLGDKRDPAARGDPIDPNHVRASCDDDILIPFLGGEGANDQLSGLLL
jgi:hypothetical protein